jgi:HEAT repeat protein
LLIEQLKSDNDLLRDVAIRALTESGPSSVPLLLKAASDEHPKLSSGARNAISAMGSKAVPRLIEGAKDPDKRIHAASCRVIAEMGSVARDAIPVLMQQLPSFSSSNGRDDDAIVALAGIGSPALPPLLKACKQGKLDEVRVPAALALSGIKPVDDEALEAVSALAADVLSSDNTTRFAQICMIKAAQDMGIVEVICKDGTILIVPRGSREQVEHKRKVKLQ